MEVMEQNITKWRSVSEMKNKYDLFVRNLKKIDDCISVIRTDLAPLKENRLDSKKALIDQIFPLISVFGVYAYDVGEKKLAKSVNVKFSELEKMKAGELKKYGVRMLKTFRSLIDREKEKEKGKEGAKERPGHMITDYGLTGKHLDQLQKSLDQFIKADEAFVHSREEKKKSRKKLDRRIRENDQLLKKKLDKMMQLFRDTQKTFYNAYIRSRMVPEQEKAKPQKQDDEVSSKKPGKNSTGQKSEDLNTRTREAAV